MLDPDPDSIIRIRNTDCYTNRTVLIPNKCWDFRCLQTNVPRRSKNEVQLLKRDTPTMLSCEIFAYLTQCCGSASRSVFFWASQIASGSVSHQYKFGSGSFHNQAKVVRKTLTFYCFVTSFWLFFIFEEWCKCSWQFSSWIMRLRIDKGCESSANHTGTLEGQLQRSRLLVLFIVNQW